MKDFSMHTHKIALSVFILASSIAIDASAGQTAKTLGSKLLGATKAATVFCLGAFIVETGKCIYLAKGDPELSSKMFIADVAAVTYNADKLAKTIRAAVMPETQLERYKRLVKETKDDSKK
jgi:hypothetical protein